MDSKSGAAFFDGVDSDDGFDMVEIAPIEFAEDPIEKAKKSKFGGR